MQDRLLFSPAVFDRCVAPRLSRLIELAHRHGAKVMFHSCGAVEPLLGHLIDLGVDAIDPVQVRAKGMDPAVLKQRYGEWIVFHGSIDTQYTLPRSTPSEVAAEVRKMIDVLGCHGGFVLAPSHVLQTDVTTENILCSTPPVMTIIARASGCRHDRKKDTSMNGISPARPEAAHLPNDVSAYRITRTEFLRGTGDVQLPLQYPHAQTSHVSCRSHSFFPGYDSGHKPP